ncbi:MAG: TIGR02449 family protein [Lysobacterales bacterium]|jgi:cell division protein ZapB
MDSLEQAEKDLARLEQQLMSLLDTCRKLREENSSLQNRQETLVAERAALVAKNEEARSKVEAMINRLKALEQS